MTARVGPFVAVLVLAALAATGCGGSKRSAPSTTTSRPAASRTVWLCRPGQAGNPCLTNLATTVVEPNGTTTHVVRSAPAKSPPVDCFYVYPTVSNQSTVNANLEVGLRETAVAVTQASRFSQVCKVYAPVYRQITLGALDHPRRITLSDAQLAYRSVVSAFRDYLAHYNNGRGIVFIGHSQGATILIRLLQREVDGNPLLRNRLVSALVLGGNVTVPKGRTVGGDFAHIPACTSSTETGCVVAYSSFASEPPANSQFGRTSSDAGLRLLAPRTLSPSLRIMCVNPASPSGGAAPLDPYLPSLALGFLSPGSASSVRTPWVAFPGAYTGRCETSGNATWLQVTRAPGATSGSGLTRAEQPEIGLHILDVNIALGNLVRLVGTEAAAYHRR
jgi:Protein of unknown function (DUF3089)